MGNIYPGLQEYGELLADRVVRKTHGVEGKDLPDARSLILNMGNTRGFLA